MCRIGINGGKRLYGCVDIEGAKNSILPVMAASILNRTVTVIHNCPDIEDVRRMENILKYLGCTVKRENGSIYIDTENAVNRIIPGSISGTLRASSILIGPLLARFSYVKIARPGGCDIGKRPIDIHLNALKCLGAQWSLSDGYTEVEGRLRSSEVFFRLPSVGATENIIMAAVFLAGQTVIHNAAKEPEISQLCHFLNGMGAVICGMETEHLMVQGVKRLHDSVWKIEGDRIVAGTYSTAVMAAGGNISLKEVKTKQLKLPLELLRKAGANVREEEFSLHISMKDRPKALSVCTGPYPEFPTDLQSPFMAFLACAKGESRIREQVFEDRFGTAAALRKMGADITCKGKDAWVRGVYPLKGARVKALDLRGGAALAVAALGAEGKTVIEDCSHIVRGYEDICRDINALGGKISWMESDTG